MLRCRCYLAQITQNLVVEERFTERGDRANGRRLMIIDQEKEEEEAYVILSKKSMRS